ncbi:MAG: hypothetical protein ACP5GK_01715 [Desulfurella sp.]|uniref:hypothetical protein n=1 Tax=Desulfurella sp. TaxID=1962857 RepID=UPI003D10E9B9
MKKLLYCSKKGIKIVSYKNGKKFEILDIKESDIETLPEFIKPKDIVSLAFESNLYVDTGEFISLSKLATYTAIKSAVGNLGIFGNEFEISFKKLKQVDKTKALFYYVVVNKDSFDFIDRLDCTIEQCVPVEIAIKNLFCNQYANQLPILAIIEKDEFIITIAFDKDRLLNAKKIHKEGFGTETQELIQYIEQIVSQYSVKNIYCLGSKELIDNLQNANIKVSAPTFKFDSKLELNDYIEVLGLLYKSDINFLTPKHKENYETFKHAQIASKLSIVVLIGGVLIFFAGFINYFKILDLTNQLNAELSSYNKSLGSIDTNINATNIQNNINLFIKYQKLPRLDSILSELSTYKLPNLYFIEVDISNAQPANIQNATSNNTLETVNYTINIKGLVFGDLKSAKGEFNEFLKEVSKNYKINVSNFYYLDGKLLFDLSLEEKNVLS